VEEKADKKAAEKAKAQAAEKKEAARPAIRPTRVLRGTISGTFGNSARSAGLSAGHIHQVTRLFQGRIDFRRDLKKGDTFKVLFDRNAVGGKAVSDARVLAVIIEKGIKACNVQFQNFGYNF
jgi:murein DD-endopeptidase